MLFSKKIGAVLAFAILLLSSTIAFAEISCRNTFYKINNYDQFEVVRFEVDRSDQQKAQGQKSWLYTSQMYGRNTTKPLGSATEILGSISYTVREKNIRIHRVVDRAELEGGNIFATLMDDVLRAHPEVEQISMNVGSSHVSVQQMVLLEQNPLRLDIDNQFLNVIQRSGLQIERAQMISVMNQYSLVLVLRPVQ